MTTHPFEPSPEQDQKLEALIGSMLRVGVSVAAAVILLRRRPVSAAPGRSGTETTRTFTRRRRKP